MLTCATFGEDHICTQVEAGFSPFSCSTQVNPSSVTSIRCYGDLLTNEIQPSKPSIFCDLRVLARKLGSPFGRPTQVQLRLLVTPFCQGLKSFNFLTCWRRCYRRKRKHITLKKILCRKHPCVKRPDENSIKTDKNSELN